MSDQQDLRSLSILGQLVETERAAMSAHAESLDTKAGIVLGFEGVLVGLGAAAHSALSENALFQAGMGLMVAAAVLADEGGSRSPPSNIAVLIEADVVLGEHVASSKAVDKVALR
jgi:hypothetical protein